MTQIYKAKEWKGASEKWYVADTQDLGHGSAAWWIPPHIFGLSYEDYIYLLKDKYNAKHFSYSLERNVLLFSWDNYEDAHRYLLDVNRLARNKNFRIDLGKS